MFLLNGSWCASKTNQASQEHHQHISMSDCAPSTNEQDIHKTQKVNQLEQQKENLDDVKNCGGPSARQTLPNATPPTRATLPVHVRSIQGNLQHQLCQHLQRHQLIYQPPLTNPQCTSSIGGAVRSENYPIRTIRRQLGIELISRTECTAFDGQCWRHLGDPATERCSANLSKFWSRI